MQSLAAPQVYVKFRISIVVTCAQNPTIQGCQPRNNLCTGAKTMHTIFKKTKRCHGDLSYTALDKEQHLWGFLSIAVMKLNFPSLFDNFVILEDNSPP